MNGSIELSGEDYHRLLAEAEQARALRACVQRGLDALRENGAAIECKRDDEGGRCAVCEWMAEAEAMEREVERG